VVGEFGISNGGENSFLAIAPRLMKYGWEMHAAVPPDTEFASALEACNIKTHPWSVHDPDGVRKSQEVVRKELAWLIGNVQPEILHFNSLSTSRIGGPVARQLEIPSLGYLRDIMKLSKKAIEDINQLDRIIAVSQATKDWHIGQGIDVTRTFVVYNGVDAETFCPSSEMAVSNRPNIRAELSLASGAPILLFVGQIGIRKGVDLLAAAFLQLAEHQTDLQLVIVGERHSRKQEAIEYEDNIINSIQDSAYSHRVHWLGRRHDIAEIMRESTILVHPARQEPLGRVLLEAAASGLPILTTRVGGSAEILRQTDDPCSLDPLLIAPDSPDQLATRLLELIGNPEKLAEFGTTLRKRAIDGFSLKQCAAQIASHYDDLSTH